MGAKTIKEEINSIFSLQFIYLRVSDLISKNIFILSNITHIIVIL